MPEVERAVKFVSSCRCQDGGSADQFNPTAESGTNPTAAAVAFLLMQDTLDDAIAEPAAEFILSMQREDGGFAAHHRAPVSDLMSTFTSLVTLAQIGALRRIRLAAVARYVQGLMSSEGGFRGTAMDEAVDPEYTYYGLGTLGILGGVLSDAGSLTGQTTGLHCARNSEGA
jgi:geranylgeranyl transferase type-2 subunit beta